jgi:3-hydroxyacyl-CoA dehydrogenase/enoyl-CoA hydratase/3-hydroxybutyryl-CoA epimerase
MREPAPIAADRHVETLIQTALDADGVLVATIDMPGRTMNVFSAELMNALDALMDRVDADAAVHSVVLTSGKPSFLAGADLVMVRGYCDAAQRMNAEQMFAMCGRLGRQLLRLEESAKPWVAAVNGLALGGGLELAMACRVRLVADDPKIQLGLPEVKLGLLPGAGGTQRMPRLIGLDLAMDLLLSGRPLDPQRALAAGLFERAVPAAQLLDDAKAVARGLHGTALDRAKKFAHLAQNDVPAHTADEARAVALKHGVSASEFALYPAYSAIVDSVLLGARHTLAEGTDIEMRQFLRLMFSPIAGNMVRTMFLNRQRADRELAPPEGLRIEKVGVGAISPARSVWSESLAKAKLPVTIDAALGADTIELLDNTGSRHVVAVRVLADATGGNEPAGAFAVLTPNGPFGSVLEIVGADDAAAALAALAQRLRALPYRTPASRSALLAQARVARDDADAQALAALARSASTPVDDADLYDVATCVAGVAPLWSGGPFTHLWREHARLAARFDAAQSDAWARIEPALRKARA